jgi:hypothetical protein
LKDIVFVKLAEFVEETWGVAMWGELLQEVDADSGGIDPFVGLFDDQELFLLVALIATKKAIIIAQAKKAFGKWIFIELYTSKPRLRHDFIDVFKFFHGRQNIIHIEVKKLYIGLLIPKFNFLYESEKTLRFHSMSPRKRCHFCEVLVYGLAEYLNQPATVCSKEREHNNNDRCVLEVSKDG